MGEDIIEIYIDKNTRDLYIYIPASAQTFTIRYGEELDKLPYTAIRATQINIDEVIRRGKLVPFKE